MRSTITGATPSSSAENLKKVEFNSQEVAAAFDQVAAAFGQMNQALAAGRERSRQDVLAAKRRIAKVLMG